MGNTQVKTVIKEKGLNRNGRATRPPPDVNQDQEINSGKPLTRLRFHVYNYRPVRAKTVVVLLGVNDYNA